MFNVPLVSRLSCSCNVFEALYVLNTLAVSPSINVCKCLFMIVVWSDINEYINVNVNTCNHRCNLCKKISPPRRRDHSLMDLWMLKGQSRYRSSVFTLCENKSNKKDLLRECKRYTHRGVFSTPYAVLSRERGRYLGVPPPPPHLDLAGR